MRLRQGDYERVTNRRADPLALVESYRDAGADLIHLVDLDGARDGSDPPRRRPPHGARARPRREYRLRAASARSPMPSSSWRRALRASSSGPPYSPTRTRSDASCGRSVNGSWSRSMFATAASPSAAGRRRPRSRPTRLPSAAVPPESARILCTAIDRDGTLAGPDVELLARVSPDRRSSGPRGRRRALARRSRGDRGRWLRGRDRGACAARGAVAALSACRYVDTGGAVGHRRRSSWRTRPHASRGLCPASHPVALPTIVLIVLYPPVPRGSQVASGKLAAHADFMNGWDQAELERLIRERSLRR